VDGLQEEDNLSGIFPSSTFVISASKQCERKNDNSKQKMEFLYGKVYSFGRFK
jgi:hypothetical protein